MSTAIDAHSIGDKRFAALLAPWRLDRLHGGATRLTPQAAWCLATAAAGREEEIDEAVPGLPTLLLKPR
jgi:hypothetical protein